VLPAPGIPTQAEYERLRFRGPSTPDYCVAEGGKVRGWSTVLVTYRHW
jgi:hypothetical protein